MLKVHTKQNIIFSIKKRESTGLKYFVDSKLLLNTQMIRMIFIKSIEEYNQIKKHKVFIFFDDMIASVLSKKKTNLKQKKAIVIKLFIRGRKLNTSLPFITQSYFIVPKNIRLNSTHYSNMKIPNR